MGGVSWQSRPDGQTPGWPNLSLATAREAQRQPSCRISNINNSQVSQPPRKSNMASKLLRAADGESIKARDSYHP